jgi:hypothetical protein
VSPQMDSSHQDSRSGKDDSVRALAFQPLHTAWSVLSSPWTLCLSVTLLAVLIVTAAMVPQGIAGRGLLDVFSFSQGRVLDSFGVNTVWTGWATLILSLLAVISFVGLVMRAMPRIADATDQDTLKGPLVSCEEGVVSAEPSVVVDHLRAMGLKFKLEQDSSQGVLHLRRRGMVWQGAVLLCLSVVLCLVSLFMNSGAALRAEVDHIPSRPDVEGTTRVLEDGRWVEQKTDFNLRCIEADPADLTRSRTCVFQSQGDTFRFPLMAEEVVRAGEFRIRFERESPVPTLATTDKGGNLTGNVPIRLLLRDDAPKLITGASGQWLRLEDGRELKLVSSPEGPLVVVREKDKGPVVLAPVASFPSQSSPIYKGLSAVPDWRLTTSVTSEPGRLLRYAAWLVMVFGLFVILLFGHLDIVVSPGVGSASFVSIRSLNRPNRPHAVYAALVKRVTS